MSAHVVSVALAPLVLILPVIHGPGAGQVRSIVGLGQSLLRLLVLHLLLAKLLGVLGVIVETVAITKGKTMLETFETETLIECTYTLSLLKARLPSLIFWLMNSSTVTVAIEG